VPAALQLVVIPADGGLDARFHRRNPPL